jgi:hypothetical protein
MMFVVLIERESNTEPWQTHKIKDTTLDLLQKSSSHRATADIGQMQHRLTQMVSGCFWIFARGLFWCPYGVLGNRELLYFMLVTA